MKKLSNPVLMIIGILFVSFLLFFCSDDNPASSENTPDPTRLYLLDGILSPAPSTASGVTQYFIYSSLDWATTLACDMEGTQCKFGILFGVPPGQSMTAKVDIILKKDNIENILASKNFQVTSSTYTRFTETVNIQDPNCAGGDILILRITKAANGSAGLGVLANNTAPNDSYIEVPNVEIMD